MQAALLWSACRNTEERPAPASWNDSPAGPESRLPSLFSDPSDGLWLSWMEEQDTVAAFRFSTLTDSGWSAPRTIAESSQWFLNWADYPMLASDGHGHLAAHVLERNGDGKFAYSIRVFLSSDSGKTWPVRMLLNTDTVEGEHGFVSMQPTDVPGEWFMTWLDGRNTGGGDGHGHHGSMSLRAARIGSDGSRLDEWELDNRTCDCCQTSALWTSAGPVVAYRDRSDEEIRDISVRWFSSDAWSHPVHPASDNWKIEGCPVNGPRLAGRGQETGLIWFTGAGDSSQVKFARSRDGGRSFGSWTLLNGAHTAGRVDLVALPDRTYAASWLEDKDIRLRIIRPDGSIGPIRTVATTTAGRSSGFPQLEAFRDRMVLAWTDTEERKVKIRILDEGTR